MRRGGSPPGRTSMLPARGDGRSVLRPGPGVRGSVPRSAAAVLRHRAGRCSRPAAARRALPLALSARVPTVRRRRSGPPVAYPGAGPPCGPWGTRPTVHARVRSTRRRRTPVQSSDLPSCVPVHEVNGGAGCVRAGGRRPPQALRGWCAQGRGGVGSLGRAGGRACGFRRIVSLCGRRLEAAVTAVRPGRRVKDKPEASGFRRRRPLPAARRPSASAAPCRGGSRGRSFASCLTWRQLCWATAG